MRLWQHSVLNATNEVMLQRTLSSNSVSFSEMADQIKIGFEREIVSVIV